MCVAGTISHFFPSPGVPLRFFFTFQLSLIFDFLFETSLFKVERSVLGTGYAALNIRIELNLNEKEK